MRWLLWCFCLLAESYETINHWPLTIVLFTSILLQTNLHFWYKNLCLCWLWSDGLWVSQSIHFDQSAKLRRFLFWQNLYQTKTKAWSNVFWAFLSIYFPFKDSSTTNEHIRCKVNWTECFHSGVSSNVCSYFCQVAVSVYSTSALWSLLWFSL